MVVAQTSLLAFQQLLVDEVIGKQAFLIFKTLKNSPFALNDKMISYNSRLPINVVTARRNELELRGLINCVGVNDCPYSGRKTKFYEVVV